MEKQNRKQVLDIFTQKLQNKFEIYCKEHRQDVKLDNFITYMIDQELISPSIISQYAIAEVFNEIYKDSEEQKTEVVNMVAHRFNLTPRSIWNILRKHQTAKASLKKKKV